MKPTLNDFGKKFTFDYLIDDHNWIKLKGTFTFDNENMRCFFIDIELQSHKSVIRDDYIVALSYDSNKMKNFEEVI